MIETRQHEGVGLFTVGDVARHFDVFNWQVSKLVERKLIPQPAKVGTYRVFTAEDLPRIEQELRRCGYLRDTQAETEPEPENCLP